MYPSRTGQSGQSEGQSNQDKLYYQHGYQECYWQPSNIPPHPPNFTGYPPPPPPPPSQDSEQNVYYSQTPYCYPPSYSTNAPPPPPPGPWPIFEPVSSIELLRGEPTQPTPLFTPHESPKIPASDKDEYLSKSPSPPPVSEFQLKVDRFTSQHKELFEHLYKSSKDVGVEQQCEVDRCES